MPQDDAEIMQRIERLPRDIGWLMVYMGVLGVIVPGIPGAPFFVAAAAVLTPGGPKFMSRWLARKPRPIARAGFRQILRFADDLERRYPAPPK